MIEYFSDNPYAFWFTLGFVLLALEALVLSFNTGVVLFAGLSALLTGILLWAGILPATWLASIACFGLGSVLLTALLWKPLKKMQDNSNTIATKDTSSDFIGYEFRLLEAITPTHPGITKYSGVEWRVEVDDLAVHLGLIDKGQKVCVVSVDAGVFRVVPAEMLAKKEAD